MACPFPGCQKLFLRGFRFRSKSLQRASAPCEYGRPPADSESLHHARKISGSSELIVSVLCLLIHIAGDEPIFWAVARNGWNFFHNPNHHVFYNRQNRDTFISFSAAAKTTIRQKTKTVIRTIWVQKDVTRAVKLSPGTVVMLALQDNRIVAWVCEHTYEHNRACSR